MLLTSRWNSISTSLLRVCYNLCVFTCAAFVHTGQPDPCTSDQRIKYLHISHLSPEYAGKHVQRLGPIQIPPLRHLDVHIAEIEKNMVSLASSYLSWENNYTYHFHNTVPEILVDSGIRLKLDSHILRRSYRGLGTRLERNITSFNTKKYTE